MDTIHKNILEIRDKYVLHDYNVEMCGTIFPNGTYSVRLKTHNRSHCLPILDTYCMWHTHPLSEGSFPSWGDISLVLNDPVIKQSFIITKCGFWIISCNTNNTLTSEEIDYANYSKILYRLFEKNICEQQIYEMKKFANNLTTIYKKNHPSFQLDFFTYDELSRIDFNFITCDKIDPNYINSQNQLKIRQQNQNEVDLLLQGFTRKR